MYDPETAASPAARDRDALVMTTLPMRSSPMPLQIMLRASRSDGRLHIEVANTGKLGESYGRPAVGDLDTGIGLANVRERLAHAYPDQHLFTVSGDGEWVRAVMILEQDLSRKDVERT